MKIIFTGHFDIPESDKPDDRGTIDNWLVRHLEEAVKKGRRTESGLGALDILHIRWSVK